MKKYKDELKEYYNELFIYRGRHICDTNHSIERFHERFPNEPIETWETLIKKGIDVIFDIMKDSEGKYVIVSRVKDIAIQLDWRKDKKNSDKKNHGFSASTLQFSKHQRMLQGDTRLFVEQIKKYSLEESFKSTSYNNMIKEKNFYLDIKIDECPDYKIYIHEGKIHKNFKVIEI